MIDKAYLEITNLCNLACSFCHGTKREGGMLTADAFDALTDRLAGEVKFLYFHLLGEPLLHPLLPQFVKTAWEKGFYPILTTNGSLLHERGEELMEQLPYKISISLHAPAANTAFADPAYFDDCIAFAKRAAAKGCITVLRLWNLGGEGEEQNGGILEKLHAAFPGRWPPSHHESVRLSADKVFLEWGEHFEWPDLGAEEGNANMFCRALGDQVGVHCDGTVVPCCLDADGVLALGNLHEQSLAEILATPRARAIRDGFTRRVATEEFCRKCIDAGAHAVIGTGPHLLRPIEIYKGCPIFYSLGDFVIQLENIRKAPADMYEGQKLDPNTGIDVLFDTRNAGGTKGLCYEKVMFESVIPYWEAEDGKLTKLILMPIELNFDKSRSMNGWPRPKYDQGILERLAEMSAPYGTKIEIENGLGIVKL